ncbi:HNH endonuclease [Georgenia alba]|uniref:DUF222 domain-containing protein n=1 Tax=Georgenia alba TaxID=2233858 RepID=A0ABW2QCG5_9MICO
MTLVVEALACCPGPEGPCEQERAAVAAAVSGRRRAELARVAELGLPGLAGAAEAGDPWAEEMVLELVGYPDGSGIAPPDVIATDTVTGEVLDTRAPSAAPPDNVPSPPADMPRRPLAEPVDGSVDADRHSFSRVLRGEVAETLGPAHDASVKNSLGVGLDTVAAMPASAVLAAALEGIDLAGLSRTALVEVMAGLKRLEARYAGLAAQAAAHLDETSGTYRNPVTGRKINPVGDEIALRLAVSRAEATRMIRVGTGLRRTFTETGEALAAGVIDYRKAETIVTTLDTSPEPVAWMVEQEVLDHADGRTRPQLERDLNEALVAVDPQEATTRNTRARSRRRVERPRTLPDGMASLTAVLPAEDCVLVDQTLDAVAQAAHGRGDPRTTDQLRADALIALTRAGIRTGHTGQQEHDDVPLADSSDRSDGSDRADAEPSHDTQSRSRPDALPPDLAVIAPALMRALTRPGERLEVPAPTINVTVPLHVLVPPDEDGSDVDGRGHPCGGRGKGVPADGDGGPDLTALDAGPQPVASLEGYGAIDDVVARALAAGGTWERMVTDPVRDVPVEVGRRRYRPPQALQDLVRARDRTCVRPGCTVAAEDCQIDHTLPWSVGGETNDDNLGSVCERHHALKTAGAMRVSQPEPGVFVWRTATGHTYRRDRVGTITLVEIRLPDERQTETDPSDGTHTGPDPYAGDPPY